MLRPFDPNKYGCGLGNDASPRGVGRLAGRLMSVLVQSSEKMTAAALET
jgi:hypothetical protein